MSKVISLKSEGEFFYHVSMHGYYGECPFSQPSDLLSMPSHRNNAARIVRAMMQDHAGITRKGFSEFDPVRTKWRKHWYRGK